MPEATPIELISLTADIVTAHLAHNRVTVSELPGFIASVHGALANADAPQAPEPVKAEPAVPIRASIKPDYLVCLEDGKKLKMLKRYLRRQFDMSPAEYRAKWGLPRDYPMVAPDYADQRRTLAKKIGLGRKSTAAEGAADDNASALATAEPARAEPTTADAAIAEASTTGQQD